MLTTSIRVVSACRLQGHSLWLPCPGERERSQQPDPLGWNVSEMHWIWNQNEPNVQALKNESNVQAIQQRYTFLHNLDQSQNSWVVYGHVIFVPCRSLRFEPMTSSRPERTATCGSFPVRGPQAQSQGLSWASFCHKHILYLQDMSWWNMMKKIYILYIYIWIWNILNDHEWSWYISPNNHQILNCRIWPWQKKMKIHRRSSAPVLVQGGGTRTRTVTVGAKVSLAAEFESFRAKGHASSTETSTIALEKP